MKEKKPVYNIDELAHKAVNGTITPQEKAYLEEWYASFDDQLATSDAEDAADLRSRIFGGIEAVIGDEIKIRMLPYARTWMIAASVLVLLSAGLLYGLFFSSKHQPEQAYANNIYPHSKEAIIKAANGKKYRVDQIGKSITDKWIRRTDDDELKLSKETGIATVYDTLIIPAGGKVYHLALQDGSRIYANVATAVRFPENFRKGGRTDIELLYGEIYCDIVHNSKSPVRVKTANSIIDDIGTQFNVRAYQDEADSKTTLIEGAVKVSAVTGLPAELVPGDMAIINHDRLTTQKADIKAVAAWKNGYFNYNGQDIRTVMRDLARSYDIEVSYNGTVPSTTFYGKISTNKSLTDVLDLLRQSRGAKFQVKGRRVVVMN